MFVLPPPPRYPAQMMYGGIYSGSQIMPMIETNNTLSTPTGPDCQFLVGEGLYVLEEDLLLATPPPHPSESPVVNVNPLATTPLPASAGTRVSLVSIVDPPRPRALSQLLAQAATAPSSSLSALADPGAFTPVEEHPDSDSNNAHADSTGRLSFHTTSAVSGASETALALAGLGGSSKTAGGKQRKPKNNMTKSNSSFISRVIVHDGLAKRLQERAPEGLFGLANINRAFQWLDLASDKKAEYLAKILFTKAHCLCHDINAVTKSTAHLDVIMGFSTGEIIWLEPISQRYTRLNKNGVIRRAPVSEIRWLPGSETLFMASFMDGSLVIFDKEKEDAALVPGEDEDIGGGIGASARPRRSGADPRMHIQIGRSIHARGHKTNPVAFWTLSHQRINAFAFAHGRSLLAVVSEDGSLRIVDYLREECLGIFYAYYGGLTCVCWSPDDKYVVTGGQDDLLSIWNVADATLAARCQGHHSWVTSVAFDPWRCDDRNYRFGSVGEDGRLCLWDFSMGMLIRPKAGGLGAGGGGGGAGGGSGAGGMGGSPPSRRMTSATVATVATALTAATATTAEDEHSNADVDERVHLVEPRARTALLPPVCSHVVSKEPLCWLGFTATSIMTSSKTGHIRTWKRPTDNIAAPET